MKKNLIYVLFAAMLIMTSACGKKELSNQSEKTISILDLQESMLAADTTLPIMTKISSDDSSPELYFSYLSDFDYNLVDSYFYAYATEGTAEEIAVIKLKEKTDAAELMESLHKHIADRQGNFREYAPAQIALTEKAVITRTGPYIALIISTKNGMVQKAFQSYFE